MVFWYFISLESLVCLSLFFTWPHLNIQGWRSSFWEPLSAPWLNTGCFSFHLATWAWRLTSWQGTCPRTNHPLEDPASLWPLASSCDKTLSWETTGEVNCMLHDPSQNHNQNLRSHLQGHWCIFWPLKLSKDHSLSGRWAAFIKSNKSQILHDTSEGTSGSCYKKWVLLVEQFVIPLI